MLELVAGYSRRARLTGERFVLAIVAYAAVGILLATTYIALMIALGVSLAGIYGAVAAALVIAGVTLVLALLVMAIVRWRDRRLALRSRLIAQRTANVATTSGLATILPLMLRASPMGTLAAAGVAAYFLSRSTVAKRRHD